MKDPSESAAAPVRSTLFEHQVCSSCAKGPLVLVMVIDTDIGNDNVVHVHPYTHDIRPPMVVRKGMPLGGNLVKKGLNRFLWVH